MRDASRIRERREAMKTRGPALRGALGAVMVLILTFSLGMIVGKQSAVSPAVAENLSLADIKEAQELREDLKFYRRLTEASKPVAPDAPQQAPAAALPPPPPPMPDMAKPAPQKTPELRVPKAAKEGQSLKGALSRLSQPSSSNDAYAGYTVQVSSFPSLEEAQAYSSTLTRKGYTPYIVSADLPGRGTWFRVRMGRYTEKSKALDAKQSLARANIPGWVLQLD